MTSKPTMIERVARALCVADRLDPDEDWRLVGNVMLEVEVADPSRWVTYVPKARAALQAMREPDAAAVEKLADSFSKIAVLTIWQSMIDEALKEGE